MRNKWGGNMSLTGLINNNKEIKEFFKGIKPDKNKFYTLSGKIPFSKEYTEKFPYNLDVPYDSTLVGTAFDYLARFEIARNIDNNKQSAYEKLYHGIPAGGLDCITFALDYNTIIDNLQKEFNNSLNVIKKYVNLEVDDFNILLKKSLFLARLEHFYRNGSFGTMIALKNMGMCPEDTILSGDDFEYKEIDEGIKVLSKSKIVSKNFIKVNGEICRISFSYYNIIKVRINIECYDEYKNLLEVKKVEMDGFPKEFNVPSDTSFINLIIECNESNIDINKIIRVNIESMSKDMSDKILSYFTEFNDNVINELRNLLIVFKEEFIKNIVKKESIVLFNPEFGLGSELVGGADADIFIDGVLYDFKTTKNRGYVGKDVYQIIGYYLLNEITKKHKRYWSKRYREISPLIIHNINKIAFYKARFGEIEYLDVSFLDEFNLKGIIRKFEKILKKVNGNFEEIVKKHESML
jgi:hypothetical protein